MTTTKEIRAELKKQLGYNSRQVSVKNDSYSMGSTIHFTIRDANVDQAKLKEFANNFKDYSRCEATGEILSGGNTFTSVHVSEKVENIWAEKYFEDVMVAMTLLKFGETSAKVCEGFSLMKKGENDFHVVQADSEFSGNILPRNYWICESSAKKAAITISQLIG